MKPQKGGEEPRRRRSCKWKRKFLVSSLEEKRDRQSESVELDISISRIVDFEGSGKEKARNEVPLS